MVPQSTARRIFADATAALPVLVALAGTHASTTAQPTQTSPSDESAPASATGRTKATVSNPFTEFAADLLAPGGGGAKLDISRFAGGNPQLAGTYRADIYVNDRWVLRRDLRLVGSPAVPCIDVDLLRAFGLNIDSLSADGQELLTKGSLGGSQRCAAIDRLAPEVTLRFNDGEQRLDVNVPQVNQARQAQGYVPPESWEQGINAAMLEYNLNAFRSAGAGVDGSSVFVGLNAGVNLGRWRLRHRGNYNRGPNGESHYYELEAYAVTGLPDWKASLTLGDSFTTGQLFPSLRLRGISLAKDNRMLPDSQRGYAPTIRGIASTNAKVEIQQNGALLYSTTVPAGPFEINDLYATGYGGDLRVIVTEANGTQVVTNVPFSSLPQLLREGTLDYSLNAGQLLGYGRRPEVLHGTAQYGLTDAFTLAGGVLASSGYQSALIGGAWNTPLGAVQLNATQARFQRSAAQQYNGWSLDGSWSRVLAATQTNLSFIAYRYSSRGFFGLEDAMRLLDQDAATTVGIPDAGARPRNRRVVSVTQALKGGMSLYLSANSQDYWDREGRQSGYQVGMSKQFGFVQVSLNAGETQSPFNMSGQSTRTRTYTLNLTVPLGQQATSYTNLATTFTRNSNTGDTQQVGIYGAFGARRELSYGVSEQRSAQGNTLAANGSYNSSVANLGASLMTGRGFKQQSFTATGGVLFADSHAVFAPFIGDTVGLVHVAGAEGVPLTATGSPPLDSQGYTVLPFLTPYTLNRVDLDIAAAPLSARFDNTSQTVAPYAGAVVLMNFQRLPGYTLMLKARRANGLALPFGASVYDEQGLLIGSVAQAGRVEAPASSLKGSLRVTWGAGADAKCWIHYDLPKPSTADAALLRAEVTCQPQTQPEADALPPPAGAPQAAGKPAAATTAMPVSSAAPVAVAPSLRSHYNLAIKGPDGTPLPKGAEITIDGRGDYTGIVGEGGNAVLRLQGNEVEQGGLSARWLRDDGSVASCNVSPAHRTAAAAQAASAEPRCAASVFPSSAPASNSPRPSVAESTAPTSHAAGEAS